jgi:hypothetical protein
LIRRDHGHHRVTAFAGVDGRALASIRVIPMMEVGTDQGSRGSLQPAHLDRDDRPADGARHMGWESRNGRGRYYTRSRRHGGRIVREYLGTGQLGESWAVLDGLARAEVAAGGAAARAELEELVELDELVAVYAQTVELAARDVLLAAGYRRHQRGEWRKTRGQA